MSEPRCPACGSVGAKRLGKRLHPDPWECQECGVVFVHPIPPQEDLLGLYDDAYFRAHYEPRVPDLIRFFDARLAELETEVGVGSVLDVGSGMGLFLAAAAERGWKAQGVEPSSAARGRMLLREPPLKVHLGSLESFAGGPFDMVTFWDSLAHIPDPRASLHAARDLLRPGGLLVVKTPHRTPLQFNSARLLLWWRPRLAASLLGLHTQVVHFGSASLAVVLRTAGFSDIKVRGSGEVGSQVTRRGLRSRALDWLGRGLRARGSPSLLATARRPDVP